MRKLIVAALFLLAAPCWAVCTVTGIYVTDPGVYSSSTPPAVIITGPGSGGGTAYANMTSNIEGQYNVSSVVMTAVGSYTGPVTVSFSGSNSIAEASAYVVMGGSCAAPGGGGRKKFAWIL